MANYEHVLSPFKIGNLTIKNRLVMGPATMAEVGSRGEMKERGVDYYVERARGGFGLLMQTAVVADTEVDGVGNMLNPHINFPIFRRSVTPLIERVHIYGAKIFTQVMFGIGRNAPGSVAPSDLPNFWNPAETNREITKEEIKKKIDGMVKTAVLMKQCGYDGVEVHAIHWGYLMDEFAMSYMNHRTDEYDGSLENRLRIAKEIVEGIKAACGADYPVTIKLGLKSFMKGFNEPDLDGAHEVGRTMEEGIEICKLLEVFGYDAISVNAGVYDSFFKAVPQCYAPKGEILELSKEAKKAVHIPIMANGRLQDADLCEAAIRDGKADAVIFSRAAFAEPDFGKKLMMGRPELIRPCISCTNCWARANQKGVGACCAVNPAVGREQIYGVEKAQTVRNVIVVGGGIAGMEAARVAKLRGHNVTLYEKRGELGGNANAAGAHHFKFEIKNLNLWYQQQMKELGIPVKMNTALDAEQVKALKPDAIILATGSNPLMPSFIPGVDHKKAVCCVDAIRETVPLGQKVVVVGGGLTGCELALDQAERGKEVYVVEMLDNILSTGPMIPIPQDQMLRLLLDKYQVKLMTGHKICEINDTGAVIENVHTGERLTIDADNVVLAMGFRPNPSMAPELVGAGIEFYEVGDGRQVSNLMGAIWDAYEVARSI
ncbi:MAG: FAD-dependent oxidoreductase [Oscillospiraceae bacterium]|jgi:2-enoate reductase|nr:FAD-dependent oxidoreductase [Oscillospiraceae bacterium]